MSGIEPELLELMLDTVTIAPSTGHDAHNNLTYGTPYVVNPCQVVRSQKRVLESATYRRSFKDGREVTSTVQVIMPTPTTPVSIDDKVTLPNGEVVAIVGINEAKDDVGPYYTELLT